MNDRLNALLGQINELEKELLRETKKKEEEFCYQVHAKRVQFTASAKAQHQALRVSLHHYVRNSRLLVIVTSPIIWLCLLPIVIADLVGSFYQWICFPIYGIPKVRRRDYLSFDRHQLTYLNMAEKLSCEYCAYVNGILAFATEIAARTEQHWCPIKHAGCVKCAHSRYKKFIDFGDAERYRSKIESIRRDYRDIPSTASVKTES